MTASPRKPASKILSPAKAVEKFSPPRNFRLVFTNGCFDLLHPGHVTYLDQARRLGDALLVAVNSDASVRRQGKGSDRPVMDLEARALMLASLESVDFVTSFDENTPERLLKALRPDFLVKGDDYQPDKLPGADAVRRGGGTVKTVPLIAGHSTTALLARIRGE